uniref:Protein aurora borealis n=3 Tax=Mesocestoides corti TaxID=53468 RepID=A0A5K3F7C5_MESCO
MNEENSELEVETPTKPCTYPALTTPSGGSVYHPFHEGYISRLGQVTVTPGLFASHTGGAKTPSKREAIPPNPFVWSPEVQGDLFPTEIDENPTAQLKLQRMLDADEDDAAQSKIRTFFHCNVIAPSPEGSVQQSKVSRRSPTKAKLQRTSTVIPSPTLASKAAGKAEHEAIMMADVEVQTAVSIAPDTDLVSLLQKVLQLNEPGSSPSVGCAAHESPGIAFFEAGAQQVKQPYPHSSLFLCVSCHQAHSLNRYSRRSMFIEAASMETIKDVPNSSEDNSSSQDVLYQSARETLSTQREEVEDAETFAEDFGLPVSWATEAVVCSYSQQDASMQEVDQPTSRPHHCSGTDLTELFDRADITPIKNLSHCLGTSHHLDPVSPVAAGRTSPEAGAFQQHLQLSFTVDDESTRDACGIPQRRRQGSRQQAMLSPRLSPIPRASGHSPMDDEFGYSNDYDFSD